MFTYACLLPCQTSCVLKPFPNLSLVFTWKIFLLHYPVWSNVWAFQRRNYILKILNNRNKQLEPINFDDPSNELRRSTNSVPKDRVPDISTGRVEGGINVVSGDTWGNTWKGIAWYGRPIVVPCGKLLT